MTISFLFKRLRKLGCGAALGIALLSGSTYADEILIAVASNFAEPMTEIIARFEQETDHTVEMAIGSSGRFYAQIINGAPFQIFFSADQEKVDELEEFGLVVEGTRFTYAVGRLVLWSATPQSDLVDMQSLDMQPFKRLAIANPRVAPYGAAAVEVLGSVGINPANDQRIVMGENIAQAFQFVDTGNAELGFVALSQVFRNGQVAQGSAQIIPAEMHQAIRQDAALLSQAASCEACRQFLAHVSSPKSQQTIQSFGYSLHQE